MDPFKKQYQYICESRNVMLKLFQQLSFEELTTGLSEFNGKDIRFLVVHIHNVYVHWIGKYALKLAVNYTEELTITTINDLEKIFRQTDVLMENFFNHYLSAWEVEIVGKISNQRVNASPLKLFTHVITHEFHHKGQLMTMCRLLGKTPPDTDIIRF